jgi:hypothetical protein
MEPPQNVYAVAAITNLNDYYYLQKIDVEQEQQEDKTKNNNNNNDISIRSNRVLKHVAYHC